MKYLIVAVLVLSFCRTVTAQPDTPFVKDDGITTDLHRSNVGRITFIGKPIPLADYRETDFLTSFDLTESDDLNIRIFLDKSLVNHLHTLAPELNADELAAKGNYRFSFYVDGTPIYREDLPPGAGAARNKREQTILRVPLVSPSNEDSWGRFLWTRFMLRGGEDALEGPGYHHLKIEIRPYLKLADTRVGDVIARGEIKTRIVRPEVGEEKIAIQPIADGSGWRSSNARYETEKIRELNKKIAQNAFKDITSIVVVKNGELLIEEYFNGARRETLHDTRSVGKSLASTVMGLAIADGYIKSENQTLGEFYDLKRFANHSPAKDAVRLKDLLTMSSVFDGSDSNDESPGNEEKMYPTADWVKFALDLATDNSKSGGKQWDYFTAGVVVLGDILNRSVPGGLEKYADKKLFRPLGIKKYRWEYTPQKVANTAGGFRMTSLDNARFGQLYLNGGVWQGRRVLSRKWVDATFTPHVELGPGSNEFYGYLFWNKTFTVDGQKHEAFYATGNGGNKIYIFRRLRLVIVITATAYNKPYAHPQVDKIMERYILKAVR